MFTALLLALSLPQAAPAATPTACTTPAPLPAGLEGWASPGAVRTGAAARGAPALTPGKAAVATLLPGAGVRYAVAPEKPGAAGTHGGVLALTVPAAGRYRVALSAGAWVDVVRGTAAATSVAHGHGPACTTMRKMVDFDLKPGRHLLQIAGAPAATLTVMVARLP